MFIITTIFSLLLYYFFFKLSLFFLYKIKSYRSIVIRDLYFLEVSRKELKLL